MAKRCTSLSRPWPCMGRYSWPCMEGNQGWKRRQSDFRSGLAGQDGCCILIRQKQAADIDLIVLWPWVKSKGAAVEMRCCMWNRRGNAHADSNKVPNGERRTTVSLFRACSFIACAVAAALQSMFNFMSLQFTHAFRRDGKQWYKIYACVIWDLSEIRHAAVCSN